MPTCHGPSLRLWGRRLAAPEPGAQEVPPQPEAGARASLPCSQRLPSGPPASPSGPVQNSTPSAQGYYRRTPAYIPIRKRERRGCFAVPMVHSTFLIDLRKAASRNLAFYPPHPDYTWSFDDIIVFAFSCKQAGEPTGALPSWGHRLAGLLGPVLSMFKQPTEGSQNQNFRVQGWLQVWLYPGVWMPSPEPSLSAALALLVALLPRSLRPIS